ncbi:hypothetical protein MKP08_11195 [Erythrobacter sp. LQ02-29]|uniref:hypothetical protein n=1 Tax=Erythrobacter sp. LQ02-29 TaxID=2920384 RepID=UPI001F4D897B|nr:hypothetical protein [Erythrobacter sp. LQ02-29]MCP9223316.1 hypothetical protein [Erythrobacter sp. LQ02-29]
MRAALLSLPERRFGSESDPSRLLGRDFTEWQAGLALAWGCEAVILFAPDGDPSEEGVLSVQKMVERGGASFRLIHHVHGLLGRLSRQDELIVLGEGVLPVGAAAANLLGSGPLLWRIPGGRGETEAGRGRALERLDGNHRWGGVLVANGAMVERLSDAGEGYEPGSALLRIARAGGIAERDVPVELIADRRWITPETPAPDGALLNEIMADGAASPLQRRALIPAARRLAGSAGTLKPAFAGAIAAGLASVAALVTLHPVAAIVSALAALFLSRLAILLRRAGDPATLADKRRDPLVVLEVLPNIVATLALGAGFIEDSRMAIAAFLALVPVLVWNLAAFSNLGQLRFFHDREWLWLIVVLPGLFDRWLIGASVASLAALVALARALGVTSYITRD